MEFKPHDYQQHTTQFIEDHPQAAIFLSMGMGKTVSTLTAINNLIYREFAVQKALVIAPLRVARDTWPEEIHKWDHLKGLRCSVIIGAKDQRARAVATDADVYVVNRENVAWLVDHCWPHWPFDMVIIDELSSFKNHQSVRFKKLKKALPKIDRIIGLTGTPAPNSLMDIWAPFRLIDGGHRLGKFIGKYREAYFVPDKRNGPQVYSWKLRPGAEDDIYDKIGDITLSMKTADYLTLPECTYATNRVTLDAGEQQLYRQFVRDMVIELDGETIDAANAATLSGKLQQLASGAIHQDDGYTTIHTKKLDALEDIVEAANGQTVLVAYWFTHDADRILNRLPQAVKLNTADDFHAWNAGTVPLGLIHPASAGHGLNLQSGGHILVWFTTPWSLELYEQANARLHRQGQAEPVTITHIVTAGTVDEQILTALSKKAITQQALISAVSAVLKGKNYGIDSKAA